MPVTPRLRESGNDLLDRLPDDEFESLGPMLQRVRLTIKDIIHPFDADVTHIHFPTTALVSLLVVPREDDPVEILTVGKEGFFGLAAALGVEPSPHRVLCQMSGESLRVPVRRFLEAMGRSPKLARLIHRYLVFALRGASQAATCNARHTAEERASRWLLMVHDQAGRDEFPMTQEFLASMLGVRRQTVTVVAGVLHQAGLIDYRRGTVIVRDRARLEEAACECYASVRDYYERVVS